jgi:signal transduction histidine kinase
MTTSDSTVVRSIVLVDDDADFLHVVKRNLQAQRAEYAPTGPVEIHTYTDPVEALVNLPAEGVCVVVLDFSMTGSTGLDWLPKVLKAGLGPVILLTSNNDAKVAADAFRAGAADFIAKGDLLSDEKRLARAIREAVHHYRLEERNSLLTRQLKLVNIELEAKNKRLHELTETAHQFVDDVAHDFRTPLTVIQQYASLVSDGLAGPVSDTQRGHLGVVAEATQDLSEMVDDFLDSSKLRARALSIYRQSHSPVELLDSIEPMLKVRAVPKKISIDRSIAEDTPRFFADLSKAGRVLTNLVVNALKVTPDGRGLHLWAKPTETGDVRIGVTDEGPGLKPEDLKIIFDRFQQLGQPQLINTKGFGLGLSIVKQLAWLNLGGIEVQSEFGKGSTFAFTLPAFDLERILACYLETIKLSEEAGDYWMLRIRSPEGAPELPMLYRLVSSFCYATDLVMQDEDGPGVTALGISRDASAWANRLRERTARFNQSLEDQKRPDLEIKVEGPWVRDAEDTKIFETLLDCLSNRSCHV